MSQGIGCEWEKNPVIPGYTVRLSELSLIIWLARGFPDPLFTQAGPLEKIRKEEEWQQDCN
jgi:hypothetical protein